jgi:DNA-directed RNA polymerase subunit RPC12/RpoP
VKRDPGRAGKPDKIACPHCGSTEVELESAFGSSLMSRQYYCRGCRTVFEWIKWEEGPSTDWLDA